MAKKYLTLEEAARQLGTKPDELVRLRERGEIRDSRTAEPGSSDPKTLRNLCSRDADSSPEVPIMDDARPPRLGRQAPAAGSGRLKKTSDSDVRLLLDETLLPGGDSEPPPEVTLSQVGNSDSDARSTDDVRRVVDSASDSDVKLISTSSDAIVPSDESQDSER